MSSSFQLEHEVTSVLWRQEKTVWGNHRCEVGKIIHEDCSFIFPGVGYICRADFLENLSARLAWENLALSQETLRRPNIGTVILNYLAVASRRGLDDYRCVCASVYVRSNNGWALINHQQTQTERLEI